MQHARPKPVTLICVKLVDLNRDITLIHTTFCLMAATNIDVSQPSLSNTAESLAAGLPPLMVRAERLASAVSLGMHGRRKAGMGQSFWQFHHYRSGDAANAIDWRQSAKSEHLYVREHEIRRRAIGLSVSGRGSPSMRFSSGGDSKIDRANLLALALGVLLVRGGERIALFGEREAPANSRAAYRRIGYALGERAPADDAVPPDASLPRNAQFVWFGNFLAPIEDVEFAIRRETDPRECGWSACCISSIRQKRIFPIWGARASRR